MTEAPDLTSAAAPDAMLAALEARADELSTAAHAHQTAALADVREAEHRGHRIEVRTTYAITVDDRPFDIHVVVDNAGRVYYHGLPTRDFASVIDLVAKAIDSFPQDFGAAAEAGSTAHGHQRGSGDRDYPGEVD